MPHRIADEESGPEEFKIATVEEVENHIQSLRELARFANQTWCHILTFELRIKSSIRELEAAGLNASVTDVYRTKELLTAREVARKLGISVQALRRDSNGLFPKPVRRRGGALVYARTDVDDWLMRVAENSG